jgi:hypothetical protein
VCSNELYSVKISDGHIIKCSYELCLTRQNGFSLASAVEGAIMEC